MHFSSPLHPLNFCQARVGLGLSFLSWVVGPTWPPLYDVDSFMYFSSRRVGCQVSLAALLPCTLVVASKSHFLCVSSPEHVLFLGTGYKQFYLQRVVVAQRMESGISQGAAVLHLYSFLMSMSILHLKFLVSFL